MQTGVQVLFGFLLMAPLATGFRHVDTRQRTEYFIAFAFAGLAVFLLIAPTAYHRVLFRRGDKPYLVRIANRLTLVGLCAVAVAMVAACSLVTDLLFGGGAGIAAGAAAASASAVLWAALPLARRRALPEPAGDGGAIRRAGARKGDERRTPPAPAAPAHPTVGRSRGVPAR